MADEASTEYSIIGQTSSISSSSNNGIITASGTIGIASTKHYVPVTQIPSKVIHKRTGSVADTKIKVRLERNMFNDLILINFFFFFFIRKH